jgi:hypothetical protein
MKVLTAASSPSRSYLPQVTNASSLCLVLVNIVNSFLFAVLSLLFGSSARAHCFVFVFLPLVVDCLPPVLCIDLAIGCYR